MEQNQDFTRIREWASERGIYAGGDVKTQYIKLMEEAGELGRAILKEDDHEFKDAIGDMVVVLVNLAHLGNTTIEDCITGAWQEIKNRKGSMQNGTFVKEFVRDMDAWEKITETQVEQFLKVKCLYDYQFDKSHRGYLGFINMDPNDFDKLDYDICLFIINNKEKSEEIANKLGLTIECASADELIIKEKKEAKHYKCCGKKETLVQGWQHHFTIGKIYKEGYDINHAIGSLHLMSDSNTEFYVDEDQFEFLPF